MYLIICGQTLLIQESLANISCGSIKIEPIVLCFGVHGLYNCDVVYPFYSFGNKIYLDQKCTLFPENLAAVSISDIYNLLVFLCNLSGLIIACLLHFRVNGLFVFLSSSHTLINKSQMYTRQVFIEKCKYSFNTYLK